MKPEPLPQGLFKKAADLGVGRIVLSFEGGNDEGYLYVSVSPSDEAARQDVANLTQDIEDWAWDVYSYSGAGEGRAYGDEIDYDLIKKTIDTSEWYHEAHYEDALTYRMDELE
jgi:hypothetical protein